MTATPILSGQVSGLKRRLKALSDWQADVTCVGVSGRAFVVMRPDGTVASRQSGLWTNNLYEAEGFSPDADAAVITGDPLARVVPFKEASDTNRAIIQEAIDHVRLKLYGEL